MSHTRKKKRRAAEDPFAVGTLHAVQVEALDGHPAARARVLAEDGAARRVRVPGAVPGDRLQVEIVAKGRKELWARTVDVLRPSAKRAEPPCAIVDRCGACPWQRTRYRDQLSAKGVRLREAIGARPELAGAAIHDPIGISPPVGYRTKVQMPFGGTAGDLQLGFWAPRSHDFVRANTCPVQHPAAERIRQRVLEVLNGHPLGPYDASTASGQLRTLLVRVAEGTGQVGVVLVVSSLEAYRWELLAAELTAIPGLTGVWVNENPTSGNAVLGTRTVHLAGARRLLDRVAGIELHRNPAGFFQTNHRATERLVELVAELLDGPLGTVLDLYAGGGLFSAVLAPRAGHLHLVESHPDAVAAARATLNALGARDVSVHLGRAAERLERLVADGQRIDAAVIDPPRAGMSLEALEALVSLSPRRVVYVSCSERSLFRDLERLTGAGYRLRSIRPVDMFPHTPHTESVCLLTLPPADKSAPHGR